MLQDNSRRREKIRRVAGLTKSSEYTEIGTALVSCKALAQPFPYLADGLVGLLGCAVNPIDPGFEVGGSAF